MLPEGHIKGEFESLADLDLSEHALESLAETMRKADQSYYDLPHAPGARRTGPWKRSQNEGQQALRVSLLDVEALLDRIRADKELEHFEWYKTLGEEMQSPLER